MNKIQIIRHGDLTIREVLDIIEIKSIAWPYEIGSQFQWMIDNLRENDLHFLLRDKDGGQVVAYLNLVEIFADLGYGHPIKCWGLGNVCTRERGKGIGKELMHRLNNFIDMSGIPAILLCRKKNLGFYLKMEWNLLPSDSDLGEDVYAMYYGCYAESVLKSLDRLF